MSAPTSPRLGLAYLAAAQAQKHVTLNDALRRLDAVVQVAVASMSVAVQPASPAEGETYVLPPGAAGPAWGTMLPGSLAAFQDGAFVEIRPWAGFLAYVADEGSLQLHDGAGWGPAAAAPDGAARFGVNTPADATNRLAVKSDAVLFSHDDVTPGSGDMRAVFNKSAAARHASALFQSAYSGRAEIGLAGDDDFHLKVSANGASWADAMVVNAGTGRVLLGASGTASDALHVKAAADPALRLEEAGSSSHLVLRHVSSGQSVLEHVAATGQALIDLSPQVQDGVSASLFRFFRSVNTTAPCRIDINRGDGTATVNHSFMGKSHTFLNRTDGFVKVGGGASAPNPVCAVDVDGPVRVKGYTVAGLPAASVGAGQIVFVSDETGGAVLAYSDGAQWRRVTDRAVVS
ncbi:hypothetical protein ASE63_20000 [Bosea sp. Root381]|uniref:DUF2793 domain-containing protein n=1 Tax=Bosea sp. Root381 TaxID=1736524 RepID=UPI000700601F|nr:DUF2793 domain-containing protein [Bosea sp. Root381]KRE12005.1 hypothetical protein ASE63_20000 [Bosea sp. Root381]